MEKDVAFSQNDFSVFGKTAQKIEKKFYTSAKRTFFLFSHKLRQFQIIFLFFLKKYPLPSQGGIRSLPVFRGAYASFSAVAEVLVRAPRRRRRREMRGDFSTALVARFARASRRLGRRGLRGLLGGLGGAAYASFSAASKARRRLSSRPMTAMISVAPPGVTAIPETAMRKHQRTAPLLQPRPSATPRRAA